MDLKMFETKKIKRKNGIFNVRLENEKTFAKKRKIYFDKDKISGAPSAQIRFI